MVNVLFRPPNWGDFARARKEVRVHSIMRCLQYDRLRSIGLTGRVLDFGGGERSNYASRRREWAAPGSDYLYESANIDPATQPTYLLSESGRIPVEDGRYDIVLSLNTLEHVRRLDAALDELHRVLRPGGKFLLSVPFLFRVHAHPSDYHRGTPAFWSDKLAEHGFAMPTVEALTYGPFSTAALVAGLPGPMKTARQSLSLLMDVMFARRHFGGRREVVLSQEQPPVNSALAYLIRASRPAVAL